jgi:hypothetical protein
MAETDKTVRVPHDEAIDAMADAAQKRYEDAGILPTPESELPDEEPAEEVVPPAEPTAELTPVAEAAAQVAKQMRKVKVDGQEFEVSEDDLVASYQKQAAATKRLQEAERILTDAKAQAAQITAPKPASADERKQKIKDYNAALYAGDLETANTLFEEINPGRDPVTATPDVEQIFKQVLPAVKQQLSNESALDAFKKDFKDVVDDPDLLALTDMKLRQFEAEGKPYAEALTLAGNAVRSKFKTPAPSLAPTEQPTTTIAEKMQRKGGIVNFPTANSKANSQVDVPQSDSEYIQEMRKARGLA